MEVRKISQVNEEVHRQVQEDRVHKVKVSVHQSTRIITSDFRAGVVGTIPSVIKLMGKLALSQWVLVIGFSEMQSKAFLTTVESGKPTLSHTRHCWQPHFPLPPNQGCANCKVYASSLAILLKFSIQTRRTRVQHKIVCLLQIHR